MSRLVVGIKEILRKGVHSRRLIVFVDVLVDRKIQSKTGLGRARSPCREGIKVVI